MRRYGVLLLVVVLAVTGLAAAAAYNSATVVSTQTLKVVNTSQALLRLTPGTGVGNKDNTAAILSDGTLDIKFGTSGLSQYGFLGLQPKSNYQWDKLVSISNFSAEKITVTLNVSGGAASYLIVKGSPNNNWFSGRVLWNKGVATSINLNPNDTVDLCFIIDLMDGAALGNFAGTITVSATAIQ